MDLNNPARTPTASVVGIGGAWHVVLAVGVATLAVGVVLLAWPGQTLSVLSILLGIQFIVFGLFRLLDAFRPEAAAPGLFGVIGVLMMASGVIVLRNRFETLALLATLLGLLWIISGVIDLFDALGDRGGDRRLIRSLLGVLSIASGLVVVVWPTPTLTVIAWIAGLHLGLFGILLIISALTIRKRSRELASSTPGY